MLGEQRVHGGLELRVVHGFGQVVHHAFFVRDADALEEVSEDGLVPLEQPAAQQSAGGEFHAGPAEIGDHAGVAGRAGLLIKEDSPHLAGGGNGVDGGAIKLAVVGVGVFEDVRRQDGRHEPEEFVGGQHRCPFKTEGGV